MTRHRSGETPLKHDRCSARAPGCGIRLLRLLAFAIVTIIGCASFARPSWASVNLLTTYLELAAHEGIAEQGGNTSSPESRHLRDDASRAAVELNAIEAELDDGDSLSDVVDD